jgi:hypothetical protein
MIIFNLPDCNSRALNMRKALILLALPFFFGSCGHKIPSTADGDITDVRDFFDLFHDIRPPLQWTDTVLYKRSKDTTTISYRNFVHFVPDTVLSARFGKLGRPKIYPAGKVSVRNNETYLFVKATSSTKRVLYVLGFDKSKEFKSALALMWAEGEGSPSGRWTASMDAKYTLSTNREHRSSKGELLYQKAVYVYNDAGAFTLILMESNDANPKSLQIINPIDTMSRKHKLSANYIQDHRNFVSIRDSRNPSHFIFFIHFEKDDGQCKGELKGEAKLTSPQSASYKASNDPCAIQFNFSNNAGQVSIRETGGCGNHRDIKCFFEGTYPRQKEAKAKPAKKMHS